MRVFRILGALFIFAACYLLLFTDRGTAGALFVLAGAGLVMTDQRRHHRW